MFWTIFTLAIALWMIALAAAFGSGVMPLLLVLGTILAAMNFAFRIWAARLHESAAVFRFHRHEFRFVTDFAKQVVVPQIGHEVLAVRGHAERKTGHRFQEQGGVRGAVGEMDVKMIDRVPAEKLGEITRVPGPRRRLHRRAVFPLVRFDQRLGPAILRPRLLFP